MTQHIERKVYYGSVQNGTIITYYYDYSYFVASLKDRDEFYVSSNTESGVYEIGGSVPRGAVLLFPTQFEANYLEMLIKKLSDEKREKKSCSQRIKEWILKQLLRVQLCLPASKMFARFSRLKL